MFMSRFSLSSRGPDGVALLALALIGLATLVAVGQPIITDDIWIHLTLGRAYLDQGPWLQTDPLLANALGPPLPAAWLTGTFLHLFERVGGFTGLRILHVSLVTCIGLLSFSIFRRANPSLPVVTLGMSLFIALAGYRLIQLRPHLFTILACLLLFRLLLESGRVPSRRKIAASILLLLLWANLHASFLLGPILVGAALLSLLIAYLMKAGERSLLLGRSRALLFVLVVGGLATLINPTGSEQHLAYLVSGSETPALGRVADEWTRFAPFTIPDLRTPPSPLVWGALWILIFSTPLLALLSVRKPAAPRALYWNREKVDPALVGLALVSLLGALFAVRFIWLGFFPALLVASYLRKSVDQPRPEKPVQNWLTAGLGCFFVLGFFQMGPWTMMSGMLPMTQFGYSAPYQASKYHPGAISLLSHADLEGTLFSDYYLSGYSGYWLSPRIRSFVNGTLNVAPEVIAANRPIRERRGEKPGESFTELLDRHEIDLFLGTRLPRTPPTTRPWYSTAGHLEKAEGWLLIYRNLAGALYLRDSPRNQDNLKRITRYYESIGVPFDPEVGFQTSKVISKNPNWAIANSLIPSHFEKIRKSSIQIDPLRRNSGMEMLARYYTALGERASAIRLDERLTRLMKKSESPRRRLIYNLIREDRLSEATEVAQLILDDPNSSPLAVHLAETALGIQNGDLDSSEIFRVPVFTASEAAAFGRGVFIRTPEDQAVPWAKTN